MNKFLSDVPEDKKGHFNSGFIIAVVIGIGMLDPIIGFWTAFAAGVLKEIIHDKMMGRGTPDIIDAVATILGGTAGFIVTSIIIQLFFGIK